jgi:starch phosphorylase
LELRQGNVESGKDYTITCVVDEGELEDAIGVEMVVTYTTLEGKESVYSVTPMKLIKREGSLYTFQLTHSLSNAGSFKVSYRMYPKHEDLPHRQDFCYVRWFNM